MEYWSIEKKDIKPLSITPTLQYSNTPKLIKIESPHYGLPSFVPGLPILENIKMQKNQEFGYGNRCHPIKHIFQKNFMDNYTTDAFVAVRNQLLGYA
jgi:hypothetical protein